MYDRRQADHRYNASEKGLARYERYRGKHREEIRERDRAYWERRYYSDKPEDQAWVLKQQMAAQLRYHRERGQDLLARLRG